MFAHVWRPRGMSLYSRLPAVLRRTLCYPTESLRVPIAGPLQASAGEESHGTVSPDGMIPTLITTLPNGLRVASQASYGNYSTMGVFVDMGSRYEVRYTSGLCHFLTKMAFTGSSMFKDRDEIFHEFEGYGGVPEYQSFRDVSFSSVSCFSHTLPQVMAALSDVTWRPHLNESELDDCRQIISYELEDQHTKPHPEPLLMDLVHQAAYSNNTLGLPSLCPSDNISKITIKEVKRFVASHYVPSQMALVGVNVSHDPLVTLAEEHFVNPSTAWSDVDTSPVDGSISQYTGGLVQVERDSAPIIGPNRLPELTHVAIAMESSSYRHDDFYVFAVLNSLMGGGGSFSAGGPGKGMYTRLYLDVLNKHHWIYHAQALNHAYSDSGIFCLFGSCHPSQTRDLVSVLCHQFYQMTKPVHQTALSRAKKQLQSTLLMNLESRSISLEDIGRQVLAHNKRVSAAELCDKIDNVTEDDIIRVAREMYESSTPAVGVLGDLSNVPQLKDIETALVENKGQLQNKTRFFSFR